MKKKILYFVSDLKRIAPITQLFNIIKHLDRNLFQPQILTLSPEPDDSLKGSFTGLEVPVASLNMSRPVAMIKGAGKLQNYLLNNQVEIVHSSGYIVDSILSRANAEVKKVVTVRNHAYQSYTLTYGLPAGLILAHTHLGFIRKIDYPVCCSKSLAQWLSKKQKRSIDAIQDGIDMGYYSPVDSSQKLLIRKKLNLPSEHLIFTTVGRISKLKDPFTLINAFRSIPLTNKSLLFAGDGKMMNRCKNLAVSSDRILFLGETDNVAEYLQASDCFLSASLSEGLPNAVMEAMSTGLPCVLSDIPAHRELLGESSNKACLFNPGNADDLVQKINQVMQHDHKEQTRENRAICLRKFNDKTMSAKYQNLYLRILES
jgi:glycosyltransferase involved in cell wall biosynthesis